MGNKKELVQRSYLFEVRAQQDEEEKYVVEGRAIVYDSMTDLGFCYEIIEPGALDNTDLTDVRFLVNHDISKIPLARSRKNNKNSTMQLFVDEQGLRIKVYLDVENNAEARALYSAIQRGDITGMSFMFSISAEEWEELESEKPTHGIREILSVVEVSAVTFPAYEDTDIYARDKSRMENLRRSLESERESAWTLENVSKLTFEQRTLLTMYGGKKTCQ